MPPTFTLARLRPTGAGQWASNLGQQKAADLNTRPFLALHALSSDYHNPGKVSTYVSLGRLFVVSPQKPEGLYTGFYCVLSPVEATDGRTLTVYPPLQSSGQPLYVHTLPALPDTRMLEDIVPDPLPYHLDDASFRVFCLAVREDMDELRKRRSDVASRDSGGLEAVQKDWDSWSQQTSRTKARRAPLGESIFERLPAIGNLNVLDPPTIYSELRLFHQLEADYSWKGVRSTSDWVLHLRKSIMDQQFIPDIPEAASGAISTYGDLPIFMDHLRTAVDVLFATEIPYDGQKLPEELVSRSVVRWEDPSPDFDVAESAYICPRIHAAEFHVVVFDLIGSLVDRDTAIFKAITSLIPTCKSVVSRYKVIQLFIDSEASRTRSNPNSLPIDNMRYALRDVAIRLGYAVDDDALEHAMQLLRRPLLYEDATSALETLRCGRALLALPLPDTLFSVRPDLPRDVDLLAMATARCDLYTRRSEVCDAILAHIKASQPGIDPSEILLVTSYTYRMLEPARAAGFQTALITRPDCPLSSIRLDTALPTYSADDLCALCDALDRRVEDVQNYKEADPSFWTPYRIRGLWQCDKILGEGSFGTIYNAFHLFTNEEVAIKVDMPDEELHQPCALPYEAKVYRVLEGHLGILVPRWDGEEGGAGVMVMDKLGPNLNQLRLFCRGKFSLKTICMLALQMITRIEFAHSRGIVVRDVKPENFAMGMDDHRNILFLLDFGVSKLYVNPTTGKHIPFRDGRSHIGTPRYSSFNSHFGRELSRRDDIEALGTTLLALLHGRLPWQGIYAPSIEAKMWRMGEMKAGYAMHELLSRSPSEFTWLFAHSRSLAFEDKPNYEMIRGLFLHRMRYEKWKNDGLFDWVDCRFLKKGTLIPEEYQWDDEVALDTSRFIPMTWS
ncbi:kinase-like protein [Obba rivulosa]|uniref:Kinase-like protein n=1 Tax=Obba rivulosa TaxID=1052685 RepID=A0A8E2DK67_9APHY|nr:kinase-like protein [Obba rivulosa]